MTVRQLGPKLFREDGQTYKHDDFANAPEMYVCTDCVRFKQVSVTI